MHSLHAALSSTALLALVLIPVALYLAHRLRPLVCAAEAHLYLCAAALPWALAACFNILDLPSLPPLWLLVVVIAVLQIGSVSLAVLSLHRLFLRRGGGLFPLPDVPELPAEHAPGVSHV